jgi:hypothetical protein
MDACGSVDLACHGITHWNMLVGETIEVEKGVGRMS